MVVIGFSTLLGGGVVVVLILAFLALAYGLYTRRGGGVGSEEREASLDEASEEIRNMGRGTSGRRR
jgi:hypothetical protein